MSCRWQVRLSATTPQAEGPRGRDHGSDPVAEQPGPQHLPQVPRRAAGERNASACRWRRVCWSAVTDGLALLLLLLPRVALQIALAVVETLQRTKDSTWDEVAASQKVRPRPEVDDNPS